MGQQHYLLKYETHKYDGIYNKTEKDSNLSFGIV